MAFWQHLREDITCVFDRDPAARNVFEILTAYPGIHAVLFHRCNHASVDSGPEMAGAIPVGHRPPADRH